MWVETCQGNITARMREKYLWVDEVYYCGSELPAREWDRIEKRIIKSGDGEKAIWHGRELTRDWLKNLSE